MKERSVRVSGRSNRATPARLCQVDADCARQGDASLWKVMRQVAAAMLMMAAVGARGPLAVPPECWIDEPLRLPPRIDSEQVVLIGVLIRFAGWQRGEMPL
ncbi:hypothetical protein COCON_G00180760 [Conger conger]|uniref:Uncharacterized protein n=1 Tax=Conger conger TaxID=82655 RepID=A0A9Q1HT33_CONCO|nr:hypothetical protein COCON_G00180760 [Conger conger]